MRPCPISSALLILLLATTAWPSAAQPKVQLPANAPIPEMNAPAPVPAEPTPDQPPTADIPLPEPRPQNAPEAGSADKPGDAPAPGNADTKDQKAARPEPRDPRFAVLPDASGALPEAEIACRRQLQSLGVRFDNRAALSDAAVGCSVPYPLSVKSLGKDVALEPAAEMNCQTALAAATFTKDVMAPAAKAEFGETIASISQASAYVCRPRHGTTKLSEHAFGNALDIATFRLSGGTTINVEAEPGEKGKTFLAAVRKAACGPFKTVLGPGSDADHALHLHFDLAPRRNGGTFCQ